MQKILITGGAGFIGSALIRYVMSLQNNTNHNNPHIINIDKLTYASNLESLVSIKKNPRYTFIQVDICDAATLQTIFDTHQPDAVMHLAAETHVDRSIDNPSAFIQTNIVGTYTLLEAARHYWNKLDTDRQQQFRFHHISTDEVYGDLKNARDKFHETTAYAPSSPYSASKASADHLVHAWHKTYGLPIIITNCSNNYGAYQFPEKLIPLTILNALDGKPLPVYGDGQQVRDWLYVDDHAAALYTALTTGTIGETYNIGGNHSQTSSEQKNIDVVTQICELLDELAPPATQHLSIATYKELITFVEDRPGHDQRYAIDTTKIQQELGWTPTETFASGLRKTVQWYLINHHWAKKIQRNNYHRERLGLSLQKGAQ